MQKSINLKKGLDSVDCREKMSQQDGVDKSISTVTNEKIGNQCSGHVVVN